MMVRKADLEGNLDVKPQGALLVQPGVPHTRRLLVHLIPDEEQLACTQRAWWLVNLLPELSQHRLIKIETCSHLRSNTWQV